MDALRTRFHIMLTELRYFFEGDSSLRWESVLNLSTPETLGIPWGYLKKNTGRKKKVLFYNFLSLLSQRPLVAIQKLILLLKLSCYQ